MAGLVSKRPLLLVRSSPHLCALPLEHVLETMRPLPVEPIDGMPEFVLGLSVIRGSPVPLVDLGMLIAGSERNSIRRFVVVRVADRRVALGVEAVIGAIEIDSSGHEPLPPLLRDARAEIIHAIGTLDSQLLIVLESGRLIPKEFWEALEELGR